MTQVRSLVVDTTSLARTGWVAAASRLRHDLPWRRGGLLRLVEGPAPALPDADGWVRVRPTLAGICGSDLKLLHVGFSPVLSAFNPGTRAVPGHELVGVVEAVGRGVRHLTEGERVVLDPAIGCLVKGLDPCVPCVAGRYHLCARLPDAGAACVGQGQGFSEHLGGGWSQALVAHETQCFTLPDTVPDERGVLAEPAAVALHAALRWERSGDTAVVIGPGTVGLLVTSALRRLHPDLDVTVVCAGEFGAERARAAGADHTVGQPSARVLDEVARRVSARPLRPRVGRLPVLHHGVDVVFDCIGSAATLDLGLRLLRGRGHLVVVGTAGRVRVDWSLVWFRELTVSGTLCYAEEQALGRRRTFDVVRDWLADPAYPVDGMVTHAYALEEYAQALGTATAGPAAGAVKVALRP